MEIPNEYVGLNLANDYIRDCLKHEETRRLLKRIDKNQPGRFYCAICRTLVSIGHLFVGFGRRLERFELVLRQSRA
jgi:hypothetical protein